MHIDPELAEFIESGLIVVVGTRDRALVPELARGSGVRVSGSRDAVDVFVRRSGCGRTLPNLRDNGRVATTFGCPMTYRSLQLKGRSVDVSEPVPEEIEHVRRQRRALARALVRVGIPAEYGGRDLPDDLLRIRFEVDELYDQTPGPRAGERL